MTCRRPAAPMDRPAAPQTPSRKDLTLHVRTRRHQRLRPHRPQRLPRRPRAAGADIDVVAVNDLTDAETLAHLLKYDSILGPFPGEVEAADDGDRRRRRRDPKVCAERDPAALPWGDARRRRRDRVDRLLHRPRRRRQAPRRPAPRRSSSPRPPRARTSRVVLGVNFDEPTTRTRTTSSPTRPARRTASRRSRRSLNDAVGIKHGLMTTIHAYTADQSLQDAPHKDLRRARAAAHQPRSRPRPAPPRRSAS